MNPLFAVRDYLQMHHVASVAQIAQALAVPLAVVESALAHWQQRGRVRMLTSIGETCQVTACSKCLTPCAAAGSESAVYAWQEEEHKQHTPMMIQPQEK